ncbi:PREDICTED: RING-H2 finger protein ATL22-like [Fragaria vesca subsp. vesca]
MMSKELGYIRFHMWNGMRYTNRLDFTFVHSVVKQPSHGMLESELRTILWRFGVPEANQPRVIDEILQAVQVSLPMLPIDVNIYLEPVLRLPPAARLEPNVKSATESSIESLEKVRLDSLEESPESLCTICSDGLADQLIARMPCSHCFHEHCIVRWLKISHLCPLCRYPMPISKEGLV